MFWADGTSGSVKIMKERPIALAVLCLLLLNGCEEEKYAIHMTFEGDVVTRQIVCSENVPETVRSKLKSLYPKQTDENTFKGSFGEELPDDAGGFGRCVHLCNSMGDVHIYVERFRGEDAQALAIEKALDAADHLVDLTIDLLAFELGDDPNFPDLKAFCHERLREDVKNLIVYIWMANRNHDSPEEEIGMRVLLYFYERHYFSLGDISSLAATTNREAWILEYLQRLISRKLGYSDAEEVTEKLRFLQDLHAVEQSVSRFFASRRVQDRVLKEARIRSGDPNFSVAPTSVADSNEIANQLLQAYGIELETFFIDFDLFGGSDTVNVQLDCRREPFETNGQWDEGKKQVTWASRITDDKLPFMCYAIIGRPNDAFQEEHFGRAILMDERLARYAFWYKGLTNEQKGQWDDFLVALDPREEIQSRVESFRFKSAPSPDSDGVVTLLSDLPRELIIEGLKADKTEHDASGGQQRTETFRMNPIGRVSKEGDQTFIVLDERYADGLKGLESHDYVTVVYWFDKNDAPEKRSVLQVHPRGDKTNPLTGVFATHSPLRPNLIAISQCDIISVHGNVVQIEEIDAFDGSPVLDLKGDFFRFHKRSP